MSGDGERLLSSCVSSSARVLGISAAFLNPDVNKHVCFQFSAQRLPFVCREGNCLKNKILKLAAGPVRAFGDSANSVCRKFVFRPGRPGVLFPVGQKTTSCPISHGTSGPPRLPGLNPRGRQADQTSRLRGDRTVVFCSIGNSTSGRPVSNGTEGRT